MQKFILSLVLASFICTGTKAQNTGCDASLWNHINHKEKLQLIKECKRVTGTLVYQKSEKGGERRLRLRLDAGQENLLTNKNPNGLMVIEVICAGDEAGKGACGDYKSAIQIPKEGSHVRITGSLVLDKGHGWNEIHPVSSIKVIK